MRIISQSISLEELTAMTGKPFDGMVKAVVDIHRLMIAVDAELHSDLEGLLLRDGSKQKDLWGINFYPALAGDDFVEFDSMINMRPSQGNRSRGVESPETQAAIRRVVSARVAR